MSTVHTLRGTVAAARETLKSLIDNDWPKKQEVLIIADVIRDLDNAYNESRKLLIENRGIKWERNIT